MLCFHGVRGFCPKYYADLTDAKLAYNAVFTRRHPNPGMYYAVSEPSNQEMTCPVGTKYAYIKIQEDFDDWQKMRNESDAWNLRK